MDMLEAIRERHSVRAYTDAAIPEEVRAALEAEVARGNAESNLAMRLVWDEPEAFDSTLAHYVRFRNVRNYLVLAGPADMPDLEERAGYYGERVVLLAQTLGVNSCWVALTFKKRYVKKMVPEGQRLALVVSLGYGVDAGHARKSKAPEDVSRVAGGAAAPEWFARGVEAALLAPTAVNQQKFLLELTADTDAVGKPLVRLTNLGGSYSDVDAGIVRLHFELAAGTDNFAWA